MKTIRETPDEADRVAGKLGTVADDVEHGFGCAPIDQRPGAGPL